jgi:hypothetical protein
MDLYNTSNRVRLGSSQKRDQTPTTPASKDEKTPKSKSKSKGKG